MNLFPIVCLIGVVIIITMGAVYSQQMFMGAANETQSTGLNSTVNEQTATAHEINYGWTVAITAILIVLLIFLVWSQVL